MSKAKTAEEVITQEVEVITQEPVATKRVPAKAPANTGQLIYVGPTRHDLGLYKSQTFNNGISEALSEAGRAEKAFLNLTVPIEKLSQAILDINLKRGAMWEFYKRALNYTK